MRVTRCAVDLIESISPAKELKAFKRRCSIANDFHYRHEIFVLKHVILQLVCRFYQAQCTYAASDQSRIAECTLTIAVTDLNAYTVLAQCSQNTHSPALDAHTNF
jgi:hypothetical protein